MAYKVLTRDEIKQILKDSLLQAIQLMCVIILPVWRDEEAVELHKQRDHFIKLGDLKTEYVESTEILKFKAEQTVKIEI